MDDRLDKHMLIVDYESMMVNRVPIEIVVAAVVVDKDCMDVPLWFDLMLSVAVDDVVPTMDDVQPKVEYVEDVHDDHRNRLHYETLSMVIDWLNLTMLAMFHLYLRWLGFRRHRRYHRHQN